jgi:hypothetical protein
MMCHLDRPGSRKYRLIKYTVEGTRTRLDRLYLEALGQPPRSSSNPGQVDDLPGLQGELESLYSEILPVAQMSVEQQYLEPVLKGAAAKNGNSVARSHAAVAYVRYASLPPWHAT